MAARFPEASIVWYVGRIENTLNDFLEGKGLMGMAIKYFINEEQLQQAKEWRNEFNRILYSNARGQSKPVPV